MSSDDGRDGNEPAKPVAAPPTSRLGRLAKLGALAPRAIPLVGKAVKRALGTSAEPTEEEKRKERERLAAEAKKTAEAMLKTLGEMKGLPLKLGQMASYIDGLAPPGYEAKFQETLKKLQAKAPPLSPEAAVKVITQDLGAPPEELFAEWEREPFAAASIGQVHRARTKGGEHVAVKVQYPGIDKAIESDLASLSMLEQMIAPVGRKYHTKETLDEVKAVFLAELDYGREAELADSFRAIHAEDPEIVVPRVVHSLTSKRVLTLEYIGGTDYETFCRTASQADRDAAGRTIWRFMFRALFRHGLLYADPHPGNYRFLGGGLVAFLDFGCVKKMPPWLIEGEKRYLKALQRGDEEEFLAACVEVLGYDPSDPEPFKLYVDYTRMVTLPLTVDEPFRYTRAYAREAVAYLVRHGKKIVFKDGDPLPNLPKPIHMPTDHTFMNRLQWGLASVLGGLECEANWRRMTAPWIDGPLAPIPG
jgi:predicted unusual protein kinase regulating ubiquinone biosynthesis (AarF/ABC1/UbiB family)